MQRDRNLAGKSWAAGMRAWRYGVVALALALALPRVALAQPTDTEKEPGEGQLLEVRQGTEPGQRSATVPLQAGRTLGVRNFESTALPGAGGLRATVAPWEQPAPLRLQPLEAGVLTLEVGGRPAVSKQVLGGYPVVLPVPPGHQPSEPVQVKFQPAREGGKVLEQTLSLETSTGDVGALAAGHTFVKGVSVVDGHLALQAVDLELPLPGLGLSLVRTYTSRGLESGPLGRGWTHSYRGFLVPSTVEEPATQYLLVGGEGTGQIFACERKPRQCTNQRGYHGTLREEWVTWGQYAGRQVVYRTQRGVEYRYGAADMTVWGLRHKLIAIRTPAGQEVQLEYGGEESGGEVARVYAPGRQWWLDMTYTWLAETPHLPLSQVRLVHAREGTLACLEYTYHPGGQLAEARRHEGDCPVEGSGKQPLRRERYQYEQSPRQELRDNLVAYTDPNGNTTEYKYSTWKDRVPGEEQYPGFGPREERVKEVVAAGKVVAAFEYSLEPRPLEILSKPVQVYETRVRGPRPEVPASTYRLNSYGAVVDLEQPVAPGLAAHTYMEWDETHIKPVCVVDARGQQTCMRYDALGNTIERRTKAAALPASGEAGPTHAVVDRYGRAVAEVVEKNGYDPRFSALICHIDAEGRTTVVRRDEATGLSLETRSLAALVPTEQLTSLATCEELATRLPQGPKDRVVRQEWCGVQQVPCPAGAQGGDWVRTVDASGRVVQAARYEEGNLAVVETLRAEGLPVRQEWKYNARGRQVGYRDSLGQWEEYEWNGLDLLARSVRRAGVEGSADAVHTWDYYPGGQLKEETNGMPGHRRRYTLDAFNRVARVEEWHHGGKPPWVTTYGYDEEGNETQETDERGVTYTTTFDWQHHPTARYVQVRPEDKELFATQGGVLEPVGRQTAQGSLIAAWGWDLVGHKAWEEDEFGYRTDYRRDSLYREVGVLLPRVPGPSLEATPRRYELRTRYDLTGNVVLEVDGNGQATTHTYDSANRWESSTDAAGRRVAVGYDGNGQVAWARWWAKGTLLRQEDTVRDVLGRPLVKAEGYLTSTGWRKREQRWAYEDSARTVWHKDEQGYLHKSVKSGLGLEVEHTADATPEGLGTRLGRRPGAPPPLNLTTRRGYNTLGLPAWEVDAEGRRVERDYTGLGWEERLRLPMGVEERVRHNALGQPVAWVDREGVERRSLRDMLGREVVEQLVESMTQSGAMQTTRRRRLTDTPDGQGLVRVEETDAEGGTWVTLVDGLGREVRREDPEGHAEEWRYDASSVREYRDRKGYRTAWDVDSVGRHTEAREYEPGAAQPSTTRRWSYEDEVLRSTYTDRRGIPTVLQVDAWGNEERRKRGQGATRAEESWVRDESGQVTRHVDANGHLTDYTRNSLGWTVAVTQATGKPEEATWRMARDRVGRITAEKGPRETGKEFDWRYTWDDLDRQVRAEDAEGNVTVRAFSKGGHPACEKRPNGKPTLAHGAAKGLSVAALLLLACEGSHVTRWTHDEEGVLLSVRDSRQGEHTFVWDKARRLLAQQDANGHLTTFENDRRGLQAARHLHLDAHPRLTPRDRERIPQAEGPPEPAKNTGTLTWRKAWDANGNLSQVIDPKGQRAVHTRGLGDRLVRSEYRDHAQPQEWPSLLQEDFEHDANGNEVRTVQTKQGRGGVLLRQESRSEYDDLDRQVRQEREGNGVRSTYGPGGQRLGVVLEQGRREPAQYAYNGLGLVSEARLPAGAVLLRYWPDGLLKRVSWPNGLEEGRCYSAAGRLVEWVLVRGQVTDTCEPLGTLLHRQRWEYDRNGNPVRLREQRVDPWTERPLPEEETLAAYDELDQLVAVKAPDGGLTLYRWDPAGNLLGRKVTTASAPFSLGPGSYAAVPARAVRWEETLRYNRVDWLLEILGRSNRQEYRTLLEWDLNGNLTARRTGEQEFRYVWDIRDTLTAVAYNGVVSSRYDYDTQGRRVLRHSPFNQAQYVWDGNQVVQEVDTELRVQRRYHHAHTALAVSELWTRGPPTQVLYWLHADRLGSAVSLSLPPSRLAYSRPYGTWGAPQHGPTFEAFPLSYTGYLHDPESSLHYARARYYDPTLGRFLSRDPLELPPEAAPYRHPYAYAANNPLRYTDPSGEAVPLLVAVAYGLALGAEVGFFGGLVYRQVETNATLTEIPRKWKAEDYAFVGNTALAGSALGGFVTAGAAGAMSLAGTYGAYGWTGTVLLGSETSLDLLSLGVNGYGCTQGDSSACAGTVTAALDVASGPNIMGDIGLAARFATSSRHSPSALLEAGTPPLLAPKSMGAMSGSPAPAFEYPRARNLLGQERRETCTAACVRMRLADLGFDSHTNTERTVRERMRIPENGGISIRDLQEPLERVYHVKSRYAQVTLPELTQAVEHEPAIVSITTPISPAHAVIVDRIRKGYVWIRDPWPPVRGAAYRLNIDDFRTRFERRDGMGKALMFQPRKRKGI